MAKQQLTDREALIAIRALVGELLKRTPAKETTKPTEPLKRVLATDSPYTKTTKRVNR